MSHVPDTNPPWHSGSYSVKRHGSSITHCDSEPIQTPGCIQSHGALLVLRPNDLIIRQASENTGGWLGQAPDDLIGVSVASVLGQSEAGRLRELLDSHPLERNPMLALALPLPGNEIGPLDVFIHTLDGMVILEFERAGQSEVDEPDYYSLLKQTVARLQVAQSTLDFCQTAANEFRALTKLDRVMIYRFHPDYHGEVYAESRRTDLPSWLGLHYPAEDIPKPAREIFGKIWIRPLPDAKAPPVELVPLVNPDSGKPPDLTYCALRGASIMYTEYLHNMGVAATLTMPIRREGRLWGLIACHHYTPRLFPYQTRTACEFLAQVVSLLISSMEEREQLTYRLRIQSIHAQLIAKASGQANLTALIEGGPSLLDGIEAGGAAFYHGGRWFRTGRTPDDNQLSALADWLMARPEFQSQLAPLYATDSLARDYPGGAAFASIASGVLAISISQTPRHLLLWFRPETIQTIDWAGNPHDASLTMGPNEQRLTPRASFALFRESVKLRSLPWKEVEVDAALDLRLQIMQVVVSQTERFAVLNSELFRSNQELQTFAHVASHDLKEPLRGIFKYAHQLQETSEHLDEENRRRLDGLMRLTRRMDTLLDSLLHFSRVGQTHLIYEAADIGEVVEEALEMVSARREESHAEILIPRPLPTLYCDRIQIREILCNLLNNALKYNNKPLRQIEIGYLAPEQARKLSSIPEGCENQVIFYVRDNGIGIEPRHHEQIFKMFKRLHGRDEYGGGTGAGLCIARMLIERHQGKLWLDSVPDAGSTFYFSLPPGETAGLSLPIQPPSALS